MKILLSILLLFFSTFSFGQTAELVVDFKPGSENGISEQATVLGTLDDAIIIANENEVLYSDGTSNGTKVIYDLLDSQIVLGEAYIDGELYLVEYTSSDSSRILRVTQTGEVSVLMELEGSAEIYLNYQDKLYYSRRFNFQEFLYSYEPTTEIIEEIIELNWFRRDGLKEAIVFNNLIYMIIWPEDIDGSHLATYDGSGEPELVYEFFSASVDDASRISVNMTVAEDNLFFWYGDGINDYSLFVSDGTGAGTQVLQTDFDRVFGLESSRSIGVLDNKVLFNAKELDGDLHLWSSDGTVAGTFQIEPIDGIEITPRYFTNFNSTLAFCGYHGSQSFDAPPTSTMQSDGTEDGTNIIIDGDEVEGGAITNGFWLTNHNDSLFMNGTKMSFPFDKDLYKSDGTPEGTIKVSTLGEQEGSELSDITSAGNNLFFFGTTDSLGKELYVYKSSAISIIDQDGDGFSLEEDCDDLNADINPSQLEIPYNGLDDDCNELSLEDDLDQDGFLMADDCDDDNILVNPDAEEIPNNEIDEDCDGIILMTATHDLINAVVSVYPNPTVDKINITVSGDLNYKSTLYDKQGKILSITYNQPVIDINRFPSGVYFLEIEDINTQKRIIDQIIIGK